MNKTAIVIGATGLVGKSLIEQLANLEQFEKIIAVTRRPINYRSSKVINNVVDFDKLEQYTAVFNGDMLFSCLGTTIKKAGSIQAQRKVDVDYQYQVAKIAASNGVKHYLLVSSSGADANANSAYFQMKGELEQKIRALPFQRISIFQPSLLLGERDHFRLGETLASWFLPTLCKFPRLKKYRPITGAQVAKKLINTSDNQTNEYAVYTLDEMFN